MDKRNKTALAYLLIGVAAAGRALLAVPEAAAIQEVSLTVLALVGYLLLAGEYAARDVVDLVTRTFEFIRDFEGDIPGAAPRDCGNWRDQNIDFAHWYARRYLEETLYGIDDRHLEYPA